MNNGNWIKLAVLFSLVSGVAAEAILPANAQLRIPRNLESEWLLGWNKTYRLGDEFGKKPVTESMLESESKAFQRAARATASVGGGTSFYLGKFNGDHVMATNHHVMETAAGCKGARVSFTKNEVVSRCVKFLGTWTDVDLTLFTIEVKDEQTEKKLAAVAENFDYSAELSGGQPLVTIGFGIAENPSREMMANRDADCVVHSAEKGTDGYVLAKNAFRLMGDPDELNPGPYKAWSFANGCDVSHGDSGSAMVDRDTGRVLGIIWTARIPKAERVQKSEFLRSLLKKPTEDVWKELSYAVPAPKIKEHLTKVLSEAQLEDGVRDTIKAVIGN